MADESGNEPRWEPRSVPLHYRFGELTLARVTLPLLVLQAHYTAIERDPTLAHPPHDRMARERRGAYVPSRPIDRVDRRLSLRSGFLRYVRAQFPRHTVPLDGTFEEYLRGFSSKSRSTIKRKVKRFCDHVEDPGPWRVYANTDEIREFYEFARTISSKTYQERLLDAGLPCDPEFQDEIEARAREGRVRAYLLFDRDRPVAYLYCPVTDGIVGYQYLGYDPDYRSWSPGTVLQYFVFQDLFAERAFRMFDFLEGETEQKKFYSRKRTMCADLLYLPSTPRNWSLILGHWALESLSAWVAWALELLGLRRRIKKLLRATLGRKATALVSEGDR